MVELTKLYEVETGEHATYRRNMSDYHTLRYVRWLERRTTRTEGLPPNKCVNRIADVGENDGVACGRCGGVVCCYKPEQP